jgi:malonyl-CoA O-methyltransferase
MNATSASYPAAPPTLDAQAARGWQIRAPLQTPWLCTEVARRMADRLEWIKLQPSQWLHWDVLRHGAQVHSHLAQRYAQAQAHCPVPQELLQLEPGAKRRADYELALRRTLVAPWWSAKRWLAKQPTLTWPDAGAMNMLWANMVLHASAEPEALMAQWHRLLATDGFLMFSCLGPDTLRELRGLYSQLGWAAPLHELTDMHDYGDMLVQAGFAEPVMDMERIVLTFATPERALQELRGLGRNLNVVRPQTLLGRGRLKQLCAAMGRHLRNEQGDIALTFEIIYGHAIKPMPRLKVSAQSSVSLEQMRQMLASGQARSS